MEEREGVLLRHSRKSSGPFSFAAAGWCVGGGRGPADRGIDGWKCSEWHLTREQARAQAGTVWKGLGRSLRLPGGTVAA